MGVHSRSAVFAVVVVVKHLGRVLAMRRALDRDAGAGLWETVSGRIEADEEPAAAAAREVLEETGKRVSIDPRPVDAYRSYRGSSPMLVVVYRADWPGGEVERSSEHDAHEWLEPAAFRARTSLTRLAAAVDRAFELSAGL